MPTVKQVLQSLNQDNKNVVTTECDERLDIAFNKMLEGEYSQLPYFHDDKFYMLTTESVLCCLNSYGCTLKNTGLTVGVANSDVISTNHTEDDDIFPVMKDIGINGAALIVDSDRRIKNIITAHDTALYFKQWSEDIMHVSEIERELKDIINFSFKDGAGNIDLEERQQAVDTVSLSYIYSKSTLEKAIKKFVIHYPETNLETFHEHFNKILIKNEAPAGADLNDLYSLNVDGCSPKDVYASIEAYVKKIKSYANMKPTVLETVFPELFGTAVKKYAFDELTLGQYIQIFFSCSWDKVKSFFGLEKENIAFILNGVRETRNKIAHFHQEGITPQDRDQLRTCNELLRKAKRATSKN